MVWGSELLLSHLVGPWDVDKESGLGRLAALPSPAGVIRTGNTGGESR